MILINNYGKYRNMKLMYKQKILILCLSSIIALSGCEINDENTNINPPITEETNHYIGTFVSERPYTLDSLDNAQSMKVMDYTMPNINGDTITTSAFVFFPKTPKPAGGYKVVVWQHGTLGVGNDCAPTANPMNVRFKNPLAKSLLDAGYVVIAPDYEGLGSVGIHPYLNVESQAKSSIAAVQAAQVYYAHLLSKEWMTVGQSQGGQASLGTAEYITQYPDAGYKGAVAGAPASGLENIAQNIGATLAAIEAQEKAAGLSIAERENGSIHALATLMTYGAFFTTSLKAIDPRFDQLSLYESDRLKNMVALAEGATGEEGLCLENSFNPENGLRNRFKRDISSYLTENPDKSINDYNSLNMDRFMASEVVAQSIRNSKIGDIAMNTPIMIIQGTEDIEVPFAVTDVLQQKYRSMGVDVTFVPAEGAIHTQAIVDKNNDLLTFIQSKMPAQ